MSVPEPTMTKSLAVVFGVFGVGGIVVGGTVGSGSVAAWFDFVGAALVLTAVFFGLCASAIRDINGGRRYRKPRK